MNRRRHSLIFSLFVCAAFFAGLESVKAPAAPAGGQQSPGQTPPTVPGVIKSQSNLVLVDAVVTDKKGNYVRNLEAKDFKVYEDSKEQPIVSFSQGAEANGPSGPAQRRYLVLFFDNSTMDMEDQQRARLVAGKFIDKTAASDRLMAIVDFGGTLRIAQNFTADADKLRAVVAQPRFSYVNPNDTSSTQLASLGVPSLGGGSMADYGARTMLLALRNLAKNLQGVPGRKSVILFSSGFPLTAEYMSELTATIAACNRANVAIYPIDMRGLMAPGAPGPGASPTLSPDFSPGPGASLTGPMFPHLPGELVFLMWPFDPDPQRGGAGGGGRGGGGGGIGGGGGGGGIGGGGGRGGGGGGIGGGGGRGGGGGTGGGGAGGGGGRGGGGTGSGGKGGGGATGGAGGSRGGGGGPNGYGPGNYYSNNPLNQPRVILPQMPPSATTNQEVLYALANGTGGFPIFNTNDFEGGLNKIANELNEYYVLGYTPPAKDLEGGACHAIKVSVERRLQVRHRSGYCDVRGSDVLAGKEEGKTLEKVAESASPGAIPVSLKAPYFFSGPDTARVDLALNIPASSVSFEKDKHQFHSEVNVLGIAYRQDGSVGARFSDTQKVDLDKDQRKEFEKQPFIYRNSFDVAPGKYNLKVVLSTGGQAYAKYEMPLEIDPFNGKQFELSGVAMSHRLQPVSAAEANLDTEILEGKTPLVVSGIQIIPSSTNRFSRSEKVALYMEVYEPAPIVNDWPHVGFSYKVINSKTNQVAFSFPVTIANNFAHSGNPVIPIAVYVPVDKLPAGSYRVEVQARDSNRNTSPVHSTEFDVE